ERATLSVCADVVQIRNCEVDSSKRARTGIVTRRSDFDGAERSIKCDRSGPVISDIINVDRHLWRIADPVQRERTIDIWPPQFVVPQFAGRSPCGHRAASHDTGKSKGRPHWFVSMDDETHLARACRLWNNFNRRRVGHRLQASL